MSANELVILGMLPSRQKGFSHIRRAHAGAGRTVPNAGGAV